MRWQDPSIKSRDQGEAEPIIAVNTLPVYAVDVCSFISPPVRVILW
jgi:hypothetical protein